jgi:hypothetical protein
LGRIRQQQRSEHRREILRAAWFHAIAYADGESHSKSNTNADGNRKTYADSAVSAYATAAPVT